MRLLSPWLGAVPGEMAVFLAVVAANLPDVEGALLLAGAAAVTSTPLLLREEQLAVAPFTAAGPRAAAVSVPRRP